MLRSLSRAEQAVSVSPSPAKHADLRRTVRRIRESLSTLWQSPQRLGIYIGKNRVSAAVARGAHALGPALPDIELKTPWFVGEPSPAAIAELTAACQRIAAIAPSADVYVSLPDSSASYAVFAFDALPASDAALDDLVRWRFGKDLHFDEGRIVCRCQRSGQTRGHESVLGIALDRAWLAAVQQALDDAGVAAAVIDTGVRYRFNRFYAQLVRAATEGGVLAVDSDCWTIIFFDARGAIRFVRSRWRNAETQSDMVHEFARALQAYRGVATGRAFRLYFVGDAATGSEWATAVAHETGEACEALTATGDAGAISAAPAFDAALSA